MTGATILILDTNQWLYLANGLDPFTMASQEGHHLKLFETLSKLVYEKKVLLVKNDIISDECARNRKAAEKFIDSLKNKKASELEYLAGLKKRLKGSCNAEIDKVASEIQGKYDDEIMVNERHIASVEALLQACPEFPISESVLAQVTKWAIEKRAPFMGPKKNSNADAAILFAAVAFVKGVILPI